MRMVIFLISVNSAQVDDISWINAGRRHYQCRICGHMTLDRDEINTHHQTKHGSDFIAFCTECGKGFKSQSGFHIHKKMHTRENDSYPKCHICGRQCASQSRLVVHMRSHSEIKPFACETCGKAYKHQKDLKEHKCPWHKKLNF